MPGIVGIVGHGSTPERRDAALDALVHFDFYRTKRLDVAPEAVFGQVWRDRDESARDWRRDGATGAAVLVSGYVLDERAPHARLDAGDVLDRYLREGTLAFASLDGAFAIALADPRTRTVVVANDRVGTLPVYYASHGGCTGFAPEAKALFPACDLEPELEPGGVVSFLNAGYCLGGATLFANVRFLEPGSILSVPFDGGVPSTRRYWRLVFAPARALARRAAAEEALHAATRAATSAAVAGSNGYDLMLSGGWDSRGILAFLHASGAPPRRAVAWGKTREVADSDPYIAEGLAKRLDLPFEFIGYDSDTLVENAASWCYLSELANDNTGWYAEGAPLLASRYRGGADFTLVGDEAWGWHAHPRGEADARNAVLPATLGPELARCLAPGVRDERRAAYEASVGAVLGSCANDHPIDRRDFIYLHGRVARFIFALGYYKELAFEVRRPFLLAGVLDVIAQLPRRFRVEKNLYISMIARYFPELAALPTRRADSTPEWSRDIRVKPELRELFLDLLDERRLDGVLGDLLDPAALAGLRDAFFAQRPAPRAPAVRRSVGRGLPLRFKQRIRAAGLYRGAHDMRGGYPARGRADVLRCVAMVALLQRTLPRMKTQTRRP